MKKFGLNFYLVFLMVIGVLSYYNSIAINNHIQDPMTTGSDSLKLTEFNIDEPVNIGHLQVFLIHGTERLPDVQYKTLTEAMDEGLVTVSETGEVNQLKVDNKSNYYVFIHSGDIVKGGKQDRTIAFDVILPPNTSNIPLQSFCVEQGRWRKRGNEKVDEFGSNSEMLSSKDLKLAARYEISQAKVWEKVEEQQEELNESLAIMFDEEVEVADVTSVSSLQLTLENETLAKAKTEIEQELSNLLISKNQVIGYAYAINGEIYGIDIYNNRQLLLDLWEKIVSSIATEAVSIEKVESFDRVTPTDVLDFMNKVNRTEINEEPKEINSLTEMKIKEDEQGYLEFTTIDRQSNHWLHKNYMKKIEE